jgi:hypothetical protein
VHSDRVGQLLTRDAGREAKFFDAVDYPLFLISL